ncbi:MAG TPA: N-6 DNA methylase, partial [Haliangium sp.]|nr:N-6 DNA methylase [Haliangium sp.]
KLGEYYTPDWLAEKIIETTIRDPLTERVLDPACGSGTFLFHAVRRYLAAAEASGMAVAEAIEGSTQYVLGMDLHPVAVTLARVTYVLALGRDRLTHPQRGEIQIPVYLGDSLQWQQERLELWSAGHLVIQADEERRLFSSELRFPDALLADAHNFDLLVQALANKASKRKQGSPVPSLAGVFHRHPMSIDARKTIEATFHTMCRLHDEGRDHIWGYYIRNLARPVWLAHANRVDIIVGNPPWLAYRHMTRDMQAKFREMSESRNLWHGAKVATHQDLSGLFVARIIQLYLRKGGRFGLVMPNAVLDRAQFAGFRKGDYPDPVEPVSVAFERSWDLKRLRPHFFPRGAAVIFGERTEKARRMSETVESWAGQLPSRAASWSDIEHEVERRSQKVQPIAEEADSPYRSRFRQGASLVPRMLLLVERLPAGPLGIPAGQVEVRSMRSANEKPPWKGLDALDGVVESEFVSPVYLGENVLPYRILPARNAIIPWDRGELLTAGSQRLDLYPGLAKWWHEAHEIWRQYRASNRLSLDEQVDYHNKLSSQHPIQPQRIVYTKSGMHLSAAPVADRRAVIDHTLYWATATSRDESLFLCAILNAATVTQRIRPLMSYGKDERHIDKHVWRLAIPLFDPTDGGHMKLVALAAQVEKQIKELPLEEGKHFAALRRQVREHLEQSPEAQAIERLVAELLGE